MTKSEKSRLQRKLNPMPPFVRTALVARGLMKAYRARPAYQHNDYVGWITRAKREAQRLAQMLEELAQGEGYMGMAWAPASPLRVPGSV
jgi:hypothetical protein